MTESRHLRAQAKSGRWSELENAVLSTTGWPDREEPAESCLNGNEGLRPKLSVR